ncbi:MAG: amino acid permease [Microthrixaceae bacterium]
MTLEQEQQAPAGTEAVPTPRPVNHLVHLPESRSYQWKRKVLGPPLHNEAIEHERLGKPTALAVFASDCISSSAYATEEILRVLIVAVGVFAFSLVMPITIAILVVLVFLILSYRETIKEYPTAGGAYMVTRDNFGLMPAQVAGVSLLTDYVLTVAVSTAAGTAALASFFPGLTPYSVPIAVFFTFMIAFGNLKGIKESGKVFAVPTYFFVAIMFVMLAVGAWKAANGELVQKSIEGIKGAVPIGNAGVGDAILYGAGIYVVLHAFASGGTAVTGVEAISNGVTAFKKPEWKNARTTLVIMGAVLGVLFFGLSWLAVKIHPVPYENGVPTVISQIGEAVFGRGPLWAMLQAGTVMILIMAANTSFADFPRLASFHAGDNFMPKQLTKRGHRLVFSNGIIFLAVSATVLLIVTGAKVDRLIPLYAIGVFTSFTMSQAGMARHHIRKKEKGWKVGLVINGIGAVLTLIVSVVILVTKFTHGAWVIVILVPLMVWGLARLNKQYESEITELEEEASDVAATTPVVRHHAVIVLVDSLDVPAARALQYARTLFPDRMKAVHLDLDPIRTEDLVNAWGRLGYTNFPLEVVECPDRRASRAAAEVVARELQVPDTEVTVLLPRRIYARAWHRLVHDRTADNMARALAGIPHCNVTFVPYLMGGREVTLLEPPATSARGHRRSPRHAEAPAADPGSPTGLAAVGHRDHVSVTGKVHSVRVQPLRGTPTFEMTLVDDSGGALEVVFLGRRGIAGISPGVTVTVDGTVGEHRGRLAMLNPAYRIELATPTP